MFGKLQEYGNYFYFVFRVLVGFMFFQHGAQKLFGLFGGTTTKIASLMGVAGIIEVVVGLAVLLGIFVKLGALLGAVEMLAAFIIAHIPRGIDPLQNGGEPALLYMVAFLVLLYQGAGILSLGRKIFSEEKF